MLKNLYLFTWCLFFVLHSCKTEPKIIFSDFNITDNDGTSVEVFVPVASGDPKVSEAINLAITKEVVKSFYTGDVEPQTAISIKDAINNFNSEFNKFKTDFPESYQPWEAQIDGEIMHNGTKIISMSLTSYINTGGAQGILNISFLNFDVETGKRLKNEALFNNMDAFKEIAIYYFEDNIGNEDTLFDPESFTLPENIGYNDEGIILLYNAYEIGPFGSGIIEFTIPFEKVNPLLNFNGF